MSKIDLQAKKFHRIHGLAMTKDCLNKDDDYVHVFIEIYGEYKISINELHIKSLMPYKFEYKFVEWREFLPREGLKIEDLGGKRATDEITKYQAVFTKEGYHAAVAKRQNGFDIYYNGNLIDTPMKEDGKQAKIESFTVTYDKIIFEMSKEKVKKFRTVKHNQTFDN